MKNNGTVSLVYNWLLISLFISLFYIYIRRVTKSNPHILVASPKSNSFQNRYWWHLSMAANSNALGVLGLLESYRNYIFVKIFIAKKNGSINLLVNKALCNII